MYTVRKAVKCNEGTERPVLHELLYCIVHDTSRISSWLSYFRVVSWTNSCIISVSSLHFSVRVRTAVQEIPVIKVLTVCICPVCWWWGGPETAWVRCRSAPRYEPAKTELLLVTCTIKKIYKCKLKLGFLLASQTKCS